MNQTPAAVLVLAASVCGYAACSRPSDSFGLAIGLVGVALGMWGVAMLLSACMHTRQSAGDTPCETRGMSSSVLSEGAATDQVDGFASRRKRPGKADGRVSDAQLSPEISAQLALVAHMQGQERMQVMEELLRRHLPRYTSQRRW